MRLEGEAEAFERDPGLWSGLLGRINPEVLKALRVILDAVIDRQVTEQRAREHKAHERQQKERIARAERGVRTRRKNARKKTKALSQNGKRK